MKTKSVDMSSSSRADNTRKYLLIAIAIAILLIAISPMIGTIAGIDAASDVAVTGEGIAPEESSQFSKHLDIWFMTFLIAMIMMFIKKFEWGVAVAVLLSAATMYITYFVILYFCEPDQVASGLWSQANLIRGSIAAITVTVGIGCFVGTIKNWQYIMVGVLFAVVYYAVERACMYFGGIFADNGNGIMDPGGAILVHMCGAYFGLGVIMAIRDKRAFNEPMYSTTHSITFAWLAAMLLLMLWPSFVTITLPVEDMSIATAVCYMAGMGSIVSAYITGMLLEKKVNPGIYAFALLAGPVCMSPIMLKIDPFFAVIWGMAGGVLATLCFTYLQPWLCSKMGALDVMGVHNLHGMCGWLGVFALFFITMDLSVLEYAGSMVVICLIGGFLIGLLLKYTRCEMDLLIDDRLEFKFNEDPEHIEHDLSKI